MADEFVRLHDRLVILVGDQPSLRKRVSDARWHPVLKHPSQFSLHALQKIEPLQVTPYSADPKRPVVVAHAKHPNNLPGS